MKDGIERVVNGLSDVNLGSAMSEKYAISRKSFVQLHRILLLLFCCLSGSGTKNLRVLASWRDKFLFLVAALPR